MSNHFDVISTNLADLKVVHRFLLGDDRGYLERLFCSMEFSSFMEDRSIVQINHTVTRYRGTIRGLHYQRPPHAEMKIVSCLKGEVFDVAVDLRSGSETFLRWHAEVLSEDNHKTLVIPEGFAHGFQALSDQCEMLYFHTAAYFPEAEAGINVHDPMLGIVWPDAITQRSERDATHPELPQDFPGLQV